MPLGSSMRMCSRPSPIQFMVTASMAWRVAKSTPLRICRAMRFKMT